MITVSSIVFWPLALGGPFNGFLSTIKIDSRPVRSCKTNQTHLNMSWHSHTCSEINLYICIYPKALAKHHKIKMQAKHEAIPFGNPCCHIFLFCISHFTHHSGVTYSNSTPTDGSKPQISSASTRTPRYAAGNAISAQEDVTWHLPNRPL